MWVIWLDFSGNYYRKDWADKKDKWEVLMYFFLLKYGLIAVCVCLFCLGVFLAKTIIKKTKKKPDDSEGEAEIREKSLSQFPMDH